MQGVANLGRAPREGRSPPRDGVLGAPEAEGRGRHEERPPLAPPASSAGDEREPTPGRDDDREEPAIIDLEERTRGRAGGLPAADPPPGRRPLAPERRVSGGSGGQQSWHEVSATRFFEEAEKARQKIEGPDWTVSERLSARHGRRHVTRSARRIAKGLELPDHVKVPESEGEYVLPKKDKARKRKRHRRSRSRRRSGSRRAQQLLAFSSSPQQHLQR